MATFERVTGNLAAVKDGRRELGDLAEGQPLHQVEGYEAWRKECCRRHRRLGRGPKCGKANWNGRGFLDTVLLEGGSSSYDNEVATLLADWAAFEKQASERGMEALDLAANDPLLTRVRRLVDATPEGETPPQPLTGILARHQARIEKREECGVGYRTSPR